MRGLPQRVGHPARSWRALLALVLVAVSLALTGLLGAATPALAQSGVTTVTGSINGAAYIIEKPANWNGVLLLYSHGYRQPGAANPAANVGDPGTRAVLLGQGYALAGSSYKSTGWAIEDAFVDQMALLDYFEQNVGQPTRVIAWGHSLGGIITAGLVQKHPDRFDGAMPMCGVLGGGVSAWSVATDAAFVFRALIAPQAGLQVTGITDPAANAQRAVGALMAAQATPEGRARLALVAALSHTPGWFNSAAPEPGASDYAAREEAMYQWMRNVTFPFAFAFRAELEMRAGGSPTGNEGVNYGWQLEKSGLREMVAALYAQAGLNLDNDLRALSREPRIKANPAAQEYLHRNISFNGQIDIPVVTLHTTADGLVPVESEAAYADVVARAGRSANLRQFFVQRAGHCTFTPAETLAALQVLLQRVQTGQWPAATPASLNAAAAALGPQLNVVPPAFTAFTPRALLRSYDAGMPMLDQSYSMQLMPTAGGGPTGYAQLTRAVSGDYQLRVRVSGLPSGSHAMHFHRGTCAVQGGIIQPLPDVMPGRDGVGAVTAWLSAQQVAAIVSDATYLNIHVGPGSAPGAGITCGDVQD